MVTINSVIETHKRTWIGTLVGMATGYYVAKKAIKTENIWYIAGVMIGGGIAGSVLQDKIMAKKETPKLGKVAGVEK